jgi:hypothetical protein
MHDAYGAKWHKLLGLKMKNLETSRLKSRKISPKTCSLKTSYEQNIDVKRKFD